MSVYSAKITIKMVIVSNYFGKNLWCTFTEILNEKFSHFACESSITQIISEGARGGGTNFFASFARKFTKH